VRKKKKKYIIPLLVTLTIFAVITSAPRFLLYSSNYEKVDAIILFLGPDFSLRQKEAYSLINRGMAEYFIIPAYNKTYRIYDEGAIKLLSPNLASRTDMGKKNNISLPFFYEDTHSEIIEAKRMMSGYGLKSAIFVSSPYHMRRIRLIVKNVFMGNIEGLYFVPTSYEKAPANFWELSWADWRKVSREYRKIIWFSLYMNWTN
jgi:hypothetical protein